MVRFLDPFFPELSVNTELTVDLVPIELPLANEERTPSENE